MALNIINQSNQIRSMFFFLPKWNSLWPPCSVTFKFISIKKGKLKKGWSAISPLSISPLSIKQKHRLSPQIIEHEKKTVRYGIGNASPGYVLYNILV